MLQGLSGRDHRVLTAVTMGQGRRTVSMLSQSRVRFASLTSAWINAYVASGEPQGKAGAYAIQDAFLRPVQSYDGCYCNVVGLPLWTTLRLLGRAALDVSLVTAADVRGGGDLSPGNNRAVDATNIGEFAAVDFTITKTVDKPLLRPGDSVTFTIQALSTTTVVLDDVTLTDSLPRGFAHLDGTSFITIVGRNSGQVAAVTQPIARASRQSMAAAAVTAAAARVGRGVAGAPSSHPRSSPPGRAVSRERAASPRAPSSPASS